MVGMKAVAKAFISRHIVGFIQAPAGARDLQIGFDQQRLGGHILHQAGQLPAGPVMAGEAGLRAVQRILFIRIGIAGVFRTRITNAVKMKAVDVIGGDEMTDHVFQITLDLRQGWIQIIVFVQLHGAAVRCKADPGRFGGDMRSMAVKEMIGCERSVPAVPHRQQIDIGVKFQPQFVTALHGPGERIKIRCVAFKNFRPGFQGRWIERFRLAPHLKENRIKAEPL